jgi:hypothetical protein
MMHSKYFEHAKLVVDYSQEQRSNGVEPNCEVCKKVIPEKPYWCCTSCTGECKVWYGFARYPDAHSDTYVCIPCNLRIEEKKPWLLQRVAEPVDLHGILHTLVLATDSPAVPQKELTNDQLEHKLEEQAAALRDLRAQFSEHERVMSERLQNLEGLLERVLAGMVKNGRN